MADRPLFARPQRFEGAPDPFPSLVEDAPSTRTVSAPGPTSSKAKSSSSVPRGSTSSTAPNTSSEDAFPTLAPSAPSASISKPASFSWAASSKVKSKPAGPPVQTDSIALVVGPQTDRDGKTVTLGNIMKQIQDKTAVNLEASTQMKTGLTTFVLKGTSARNIEAAKKMLTARLSKVVTLTVDAPVSTLGSIIGPKGTLSFPLSQVILISALIDCNDSQAPL